MFERIEIGGYVIEFDRQATTAAYSSIPVAGPEQCSCWYCKNWVAGRESLVPEEIRKLLDRLGVPINGEIEVSEVTTAPHQHLYMGWYYIVGRVAAEPGDTKRKLAVPVGTWEIFWTNHITFPVPAFKDREICQMEFSTYAGKFIGGDPE